MRAKDFVTLEKRLLPNLPNFTIKGPLLFIVPIGHTLRGFHFDGSSFDKKAFYVTRSLCLCMYLHSIFT